jgi:hypothetical protein
LLAVSSISELLCRCRSCAAVKTSNARLPDCAVVAKIPAKTSARISERLADHTQDRLSHFLILRITPIVGLPEIAIQHAHVGLADMSVCCWQWV